MSMGDMTDGFVKSTEATFGKAHSSRENVRNARRVVVKVGVLLLLDALCRCHLLRANAGLGCREMCYCRHVYAFSAHTACSLCMTPSRLP